MDYDPDLSGSLPTRRQGNAPAPVLLRSNTKTHRRR